MTERRYADPTALRRGVTDRLRTLAREQQAQLADLQRQFAYDRLLARLFLSEPDRWVLKGATALLARLHGAARHTVDIDLYRPEARLEEAEAALRTAAAIDLGDSSGSCWHRGAGFQIAGGLLVPSISRLFRRRTDALLIGGVVGFCCLALLGLSPGFAVALVLLAVNSFIFAVTRPMRSAYMNGVIPSAQRARCCHSTR
jgi:hypothetical protein